MPAQFLFTAEYLERLNEAYFERNQDIARPQSNNYGSTNDSIHIWDLFYTTVSAGAGNDTIDLEGEPRDITVYAGSGDDDIWGGDGDDTIYGGSGADRIAGGNGNDTVHGGSGNDNLDDEFYGDDTFYGGSGNDHIEGGYGNDKLYGGVDNDALYGQSGDDELDGGFGADILDGGMGSDVLTGGGGADAFRFADPFGRNPSKPSNPDQITDFSWAQGDVVDLRDLDSNFDRAGFQHDLWVTSGPSNDVGAIWVEGEGADRSIHINTSMKAGAEMVIDVHLTDAASPLAFLLWEGAGPLLVG
jgi:Ca2+-binding RTX toxin-like protein